MTQYALVADLASHGIPAAALASITTQNQQNALDAASSEADGYLASRYTLPLKSWPVELTKFVCQIATFELMALRGFAPEGADELIEGRAKSARKWLADVSRGLITPPGIVDSSTIGRRAKPNVITGLGGNSIGGNTSTGSQRATGGPSNAYPFPAGTTPGTRGW